MDARFRDVEGLVVEEGPRSRRRHMREFHPMMFEEIARSVSKDGDDPFIILIIAGFIREDLPWLAEILVESYREMRERNSPGSVQRAVRKLRRIISNIARRDVMFELAGPSKDAHVVMMELPRVLDHMLHRLEMLPRRATDRT